MAEVMNLVALYQREDADAVVEGLARTVSTLKAALSSVGYTVCTVCCASIAAVFLGTLDSRRPWQDYLDDKEQEDFLNDLSLPDQVSPGLDLVNALPHMGHYGIVTRRMHFHDHVVGGRDGSPVPVNADVGVMFRNLCEDMVRKTGRKDLSLTVRKFSMKVNFRRARRLLRKHLGFPIR